MRIALLTDGLWPDKIGGMQKHSYYLAKYFSLNNIKVDLYYCANDAKVITDLFSFEESLNIKFYKVNFPEFRFNFPGHYVLSSYFYSKKLYKGFKKQNEYDFTYAQGFTGWYFVKKNVRIGSNLHGLEMFQEAFDFKSKLIQYLLRIPAKRIITKSAISFSLGGRLTDILKSQKAIRIKETPIGIGEEWLHRNTNSNEKINFVFVGRNEKRKGLDLLFETIKKLDTQKYMFHFIGISEYPLMNDSSNLIFYGELKNAQKIREILSHCDCLVCPSISEGMPTVILEAMAMELSIIATDTGATSLLVDKKNGLLIQPNNKLELLNALNFFVSINQSELQLLKNNSFKKVSENYIWPISIKTTIQALQYQN